MQHEGRPVTVKRRCDQQNLFFPYDLDLLKYSFCLYVEIHWSKHLRCSGENFLDRWKITFGANRRRILHIDEICGKNLQNRRQNAETTSVNSCPCRSCARKRNQWPEDVTECVSYVMMSEQKITQLYFNRDEINPPTDIIKCLVTSFIFMYFDSNHRTKVPR